MRLQLKQDGRQSETALMIQRGVARLLRASATPTVLRLDGNKPFRMRHSASLKSPLLKLASKKQP